MPICIKRARGRNAYTPTQEAVEYFQRALALLDGIPPDELRGSWWQEMASRLYESLGDVLEWTGEHDQARLAYQGALAYVPGDERLRQAHLWRKMGNVWRLQRQYHKALKNYDFAETALGSRSPVHAGVVAGMDPNPT